MTTTAIERRPQAPDAEMAGVAEAMELHKARVALMRDFYRGPDGDGNLCEAERRGFGIPSPLDSALVACCKKANLGGVNGDAARGFPALPAGFVDRDHDGLA